MWDWTREQQRYVPPCPIYTIKQCPKQPLIASRPRTQTRIMNLIFNMIYTMCVPVKMCHRCRAVGINKNKCNEKNIMCKTISSNKKINSTNVACIILSNRLDYVSLCFQFFQSSSILFNLNTSRSNYLFTYIGSFFWIYL